MELRLLGLYFVLISCASVIFFGYSVHATLPFNPINPPLEYKTQIRAILPQGWKFFTRNPREEHIRAFAKDGRGAWMAVGGPNASQANWFGLKRTTRAQNIEIGLLSTSVRNQQWIQCKNDLDRCLDAIEQPTMLVNDSPTPILCGDIALVKQPPIPWAWSRSKRRIVMPSTCVRLNVSCTQVSSN